MIAKNKALGCGCGFALLLLIIFGAFLFGAYYGKGLIDVVRDRFERIYNNISEGVDGVGDDLKDVVDDVKEGVDEDNDDSYVL